MKIKVQTLDENLKEVVKEYDLNELQVETEEQPQVETENQQENAIFLEEASTMKCDKKTITSMRLPDGVSVSVRGVRVIMRTHRLYAQVCYPSDAEQSLRDAINDCLGVAAGAALAAAGLAALTPASLAGAVGTAGGAFKTAFVACMGAKLSDAITFKVDYESYR